MQNGFYHAQSPKMLSVNPNAQNTKERIESASPVLLYVVFSDLEKKTMDKIPKIMDAATIHAENVNKTAIQCETLALNILISSSVLKFMKMPKGIFNILIKTANTPKSKALFALILPRKDSVGI